MRYELIIYRSKEDQAFLHLEEAMEEMKRSPMKNHQHPSLQPQVRRVPVMCKAEAEPA